MIEKSCLFCKHSSIGNLETIKEMSDLYNKIDCELHGFGSQNRASECKDYDDNELWKQKNDLDKDKSRK